MSRTLLAAAAAGLALALGGCGGPSVVPAFTARATAICRATDGKLGSLAAPQAGSTGSGSGSAALAKLVGEEIPIDEAEVRRLAALSAPSGLRVAFADAVAEAGSDVKLLVKVEAALRGHSQTALSAVTSQSGAASAIAVAGMKRLHLPVCARNL